MGSRFATDIDELPTIVPIFPLQGAVLLPRAHLPLNIFEPRYLNMTHDAMSGDRLLAMVQPTEPERIDPADQPPVYRTGCVGCITSYTETDDGRLLITLTGVCRFDVVEELPLANGYRRVQADYGSYRSDLTTEPEAEIDRERLLTTLRGYFETRSLSTDWTAIEETSDELLVNSLAMMCPLKAREKQALLECSDLTQRCETMVALLEMATLAGEGGKDDLAH